MIGRAAPILLGATVLLCGCGPATVQSKQGSAEFACLMRSFMILGLVDENEDDQTQGGDETPFVDESMFDRRPDFRFVSTGQYVIDFGTVPMAAPRKPYRLRCTGDFNRSTLSSVQIDGRLVRPKPTEVWSFETWGSPPPADNSEAPLPER